MTVTIHEAISDIIRINEHICDFFKKNVWTEREADRWSNCGNMVRKRRNAIHAYQDREIGTFDDFREAVIKYRAFLLNCEGTVPYPDEDYAYPSDIYEMCLKGHKSEPGARHVLNNAKPANNVVFKS